MAEDRTIKGSMSADMPEESAAALKSYFKDPDKGGADVLLGAIHGLTLMIADVDGEAIDIFLPVLFPALSYALERFRSLEPDAIDPDWRRNLLLNFGTEQEKVN